MGGDETGLQPRLEISQRVGRKSGVAGPAKIAAAVERGSRRRCWNWATSNDNCAKCIQVPSLFLFSAVWSRICLRLWANYVAFASSITQEQQHTLKNVEEIECTTLGMTLGKALSAYVHAHTLKASLPCIARWLSTITHSPGSRRILATIDGSLTKD